MQNDTPYLSLPTNAAQNGQTFHAIPPSTIIAFLTGLLFPVVCQFIIDLLDTYSNRRTHSTFLPRAKLLMLIATYYGSCLIATALMSYAMVNQLLDIGCAAVGVLMSIYASPYSHSSSWRLYKIMRSAPLYHVPDESHQAASLRSYALRQLSRLAVSSDMWGMLPFDVYLDLVSFCVQLVDAPLLDMLVHMELSYSTASRLIQIQSRLHAFRAQFHVNNPLVRKAFKALARRALNDNHADESFTQNVETAMWCLQYGDHAFLHQVLGGFC